MQSVQQITLIDEMKLVEAKGKIARLERENHILREQVKALNQGRRHSVKALEDRYGLCGLTAR